MLRGAATVVVISLLGASAACKPVHPPQPPAALQGACHVRGRTTLDANERLYLGPASGTAPVAVFTGRELDVEVAPLEPRGDHRVRVTARSDGFVLEGWLGANAVTLRTTRDLAAVAGHAWIVRGARLGVVSDPSGAPRIEALRSDFAGIAVAATCDALTLNERGDTEGAAMPARHAHMRRDRAPLLDAPGGAVVLDLHARRPGPTFGVIETRDGAARVLSQHAVRITGWMHERDLEPGAGPDCDDCDGPGVRDLWDRCPDVAEADGDRRDVAGCPDAVPPPVRIRSPRDMAIHASPARDAIVIGRVEQGAEVYVLDRRGGWGRVRPLTFVVTPDGGTDFWAELPDR